METVKLAYLFTNCAMDTASIYVAIVSTVANLVSAIVEVITLLDMVDKTCHDIFWCILMSFCLFYVF